MKKLLLFAVGVTALMISCMNKGQKGSADGKDSLAAVIDSIIEENDTTPLPMFLIGDDGKYMQMLYWLNFEEPVKSGDDDEWVEMAHRSWERQEMFRRNAAHYTNLLTEKGSVKVKFIDEVLKDPDGNTPSIGEIHGRKEIPSLCARFDYVNPKDKIDESWGLVIVTDSYLNTRERLDVKSCRDDEYNYPSLPADIVKQLEAQYGMEVQASHKTCTIGDHYTMGAIEFKGEYKNAPKVPYDPDRKYALALEVLIDSDKVYVLEQLGFYDEEYGNSWNADADGYYPNTIVAAFEGPKGLELCYTHSAPESFCIGMLFPREDKLIELEYECYQSMVDEAIPVWKKDLAGEWGWVGGDDYDGPELLLGLKLEGDNIRVTDCSVYRAYGFDNATATYEDGTLKVSEHAADNYRIEMELRPDENGDLTGECHIRHPHSVDYDCNITLRKGHFEYRQ